MDSIVFERINNLCKENHVTIKKLSEDLGLSDSLIRKWRATTTPSIDKVRLIAEYFGVSTDYLIGLSDVREPAEKLMGDEDFVSLQRARNRMEQRDRDRMMQMLRLAFESAFNDNESDDTP